MAIQSNRRCAERAIEILEAGVREWAAADGFDVDSEPHGLFRALMDAMSRDNGRHWVQAMKQAVEEVG